MKLIPSYKPLDITLIRRDKLKKHLRDEAGISGTTLAKMSNREFVALSIIARICDYLDCRIEDVVEFIPDISHYDHMRNEKGLIEITRKEK